MLFENISCVFSREILLITFIYADTWQFFGSSYFLCYSISDKQRIQLKAFFVNFDSFSRFPFFDFFYTSNPVIWGTAKQGSFDKVIHGVWAFCKTHFDFFSLKIAKLKHFINVSANANMLHLAWATIYK